MAVGKQEIAKFQEQAMVAIAQQSETLSRWGLDKDHFGRAVVEAIVRNPALVQQDRASLLRALRQCCQDGLIPNGYEAALVGSKQGVQYLPMVGGLQKIAYKELGVTIHASTVTEDEDGQVSIRMVHGQEPSIERTHTFRKADSGKQPEVIGAYAIFQVPDEEHSRVVIFDHHDIRNARNASNRRSEGGPWDKWAKQMAEKAVIKSAIRRILFLRPDSPIGDVIRRDEEDEYGPVTIDLGDLPEVPETSQRRRSGGRKADRPTPLPAPTDGQEHHVAPEGAQEREDNGPVGANAGTEGEARNKGTAQREEKTEAVPQGDPPAGDPAAQTEAPLTGVVEPTVAGDRESRRRATDDDGFLPVGDPSPTPPPHDDTDL